MKLIRNLNEVSKDDIKSKLDKFDFGEIKQIKRIDTSGNIAYIIETETGKYFLRLAPDGPRWRSRSEIHGEIELLKYLKKHDIPVPEPIRNKKGEEIISCGNHHGYVRRFTEGKEKMRPSFAEIEKFGEMLGTFHTLVENYKTTHRRMHIWDEKQTKKHFKEDKKLILKSNLKEKKEFVRHIEQELARLHFPKNLPSGTIHEDMGKRHVIWKGKKIVAVLDLDRSYYGKIVLDLGQAIRGWCFKNNWQTWSNKNFQMLLKGYERKRKLSLIERKYLLNAIRFGILERSISFALRYARTHDSEDEKFAWDSLTKQIPMVDLSIKE